MARRRETTLRSDSTVTPSCNLHFSAAATIPQMEFAAALISVGNASINGQEHAERAIAGAKNDSLLARNLSAHFLGAQSETLSAMITRTKLAAKTDKE